MCRFKLVDWLVLSGLIGIIYGTLPFGPKIIRSVCSIIGKEMFSLTIFVLAVFGAIAISAYTLRSAGSLTTGYLARIVLVGGILYFMGRLITIPAERLHFIEYALLGVAVERVLRPHIQDAGRPFVAMLCAYFIGMGDEAIQWLLPNRHGEIMDVFLNGWGGVLGILLLPWPQQGLTSSSNALIFFVITIAIILSILFTFGTRDFGHMIVDERRGFRFRSRLSPVDLREYDLENGRFLGEILKQDISLSYPRFLRKYPANIYPFLHEMRVHIFRRDRYSEAGGPKSCWTALRENQILENYFGTTLVEAGLDWPEDRARALAERCSRWESLSYTSLVSNKVITAFSPFQFVIIGAVLVSFNGMLFLITSRRLS
jgi:hypothetical protein